MTVLVTGGNGQLGAEIVAAFHAAGHEVSAATHADIEISDQASVEAAMARWRPSIVVNTAAFHQTDRCETEPLEAYRVNAIGPLHLARACRTDGALCLHISTDYVFDGRKGTAYTEDDTPDPINVYGCSKLAGEQAIRAVEGRWIVVRTSGLYGTHPCRAKGGLNFVQRMLQLGRERGAVKVVTDEVTAPTYTQDLARQIVSIAGSQVQGVVHASSHGSCSWHDFAIEIFRLAKLDVKVHPASGADFPSKAPRPAYSVLKNARLAAAGLDQMRPWQEGLRAYLESQST